MTIADSNFNLDKKDQYQIIVDSNDYEHYNVTKANWYVFVAIVLFYRSAEETPR